MKIATIEDAKNIIENIIGSEANISGNSILFTLNGIAVNAVFDSINKELIISGYICQFGEIEESRRLEFTYALLTQNVAMLPYAFAAVTEINDDNEEDDPIVLIDKLSLVDLCEEELEISINHLKNAILNCVPVFNAFQVESATV